ncbi:MAG: NUDIX hydrolase [Anaerolineae bacterium]|jgi:8-oxo-dGTP diphosphatase
MAAVTESERDDVAYALIVDPETGRILLVGYPGGGWSLPGGVREPGETLAETAIRETMEEVGVVVAVERLIAVNERFPNPHAVFFIFRARIIDGTPTATDDEETDRFKWVDPQEANDLLSHWGMDFALHDEYHALYHTGPWADRD